MNFLAHAFLSGTNPKIMAGNFIGDFVKGKSYLNYDTEVRSGILLHREIDQFSDTHPRFKDSKGRLVDGFGHYAGVIVDMFYDHLLAKNFSHYSNQDLKTFTNHLYSSVEEFVNPLPGKAAYVFPYMKKDNWLFHYQYFEGLEQALMGMSRRTKFDVRMQESMQLLKQHESSFFSEFDEFLPEAIRFSEGVINRLPKA